MRRRVCLAIPILMAAVAACGGNSSGPATPTQTSTTQTGGSFTVYALSASPSLPVSANEVTGATLTGAIANITLGSASLKLSYTRPQ